MKRGDLVKINRRYDDRSSSFSGILLEYHPIKWYVSGPLGKIAIVKMLIGEKIHEITLYREDSVETL